MIHFEVTLGASPSAIPAGTGKEIDSSSSSSPVVSVPEDVLLLFFADGFDGVMLILRTASVEVTIGSSSPGRYIVKCNKQNRRLSIFTTFNHLHFFGTKVDEIKKIRCCD